MVSTSLQIRSGTATTGSMSLKGGLRIVAVIDELQLFVAKRGQMVGLAFKKNTDLQAF